MKMRTYSCVLVSKKNKEHEVPLSGVTKQELQLLAFIHGIESLPTARIRSLGLNDVLVRRGKTPEENVYVESEMDEYQRLATKYESLVNPGRGKTYVETCFNVKLTGFDHILEEVNALDAMEQAARDADAAEATAAISVGGAVREATLEKAAADAAKTEPVGSKLFASARP